jgi:hypothetical protein
MFDIRALVGRILEPATMLVQGMMTEVVHSGAIKMISDALGATRFEDVRAELSAIGEKLATKIVAGLPAMETEAATDLLRLCKAIDGTMSTLDIHSSNLSAITSNLSQLAQRIGALETRPAPVAAAPLPVETVAGMVDKPAPVLDASAALARFAPSGATGG